MKFLSIDIEATGLEPHDQILEFAAIPIDTDTHSLAEDLKLEIILYSKPFEEIKHQLNPWVVENNKKLIDRSHQEGISINEFKITLTSYLESPKVLEFFGNEKIVLFGKSMSAIDIPFIKRDLSWQWFDRYFSHRQLDLSCVVYGLIDMKILPKECSSGSALMKYFGLGEVAHTALQDAMNTAKVYFKILERVKSLQG